MSVSRMSLSRAALARFALFALLLFTASCGDGGAKKATGPTIDRSVSHWQDAFDSMPEIFAVVRPQAMKRDAVYGPLVSGLSRIAAARSAAGATVRSMEAMESSEEVIVGFRRDSADALVVMRGVRADLDAAKLVDAYGHPLWRGGTQGRLQELVREDRQTLEAASLFVLPERTWVVAVGEARARARQAFATPFDRPAPKFDADALVIVRFDGAALVRATPGLRAGRLEAIGKKLGSLVLMLRPGKGGVVATFVYDDEEAAAWAEMTLKRIVEGLVREGGERFAWLKDADVSRQASTVTAHVAVPPRLLQELPNVRISDVGL